MKSIGVRELRQRASEYLRRDIFTFIPLTLLLIAATLYYQFRSLVGMLLPLTTVGLSCIWMLGMIGLLGRSISIVSSALAAGRSALPPKRGSSISSGAWSASQNRRYWSSEPTAMFR